MRVSFIGTGLMGRPMAERLLAGGYELTVYNRTIEKALPLAERGARLAASAREAIEAGSAPSSWCATPQRRSWLGKGGRTTRCCMR